MDYYEELGVDRAASAEEIRQAYHRVARLLHPDHCPDELRRTAELQMTRLNGIQQVLLDPHQRAAYDQSDALPRRAKPKWMLWLWPTATAVALVIAVLTAMHPRGSPAPPAPAAVPQPPVSKPRPIKKVTRRHPAPFRMPAEPAQAAALDLPEPAPVEPGFPRLASPLEIAAAAPPAPLHFAGEWFFVPGPAAGRTELYPPEYIQLRVSEDSGLVRGRYRARYRIPNPAISPDVNFQFEGREAGRLPWRGPGGAAGEIALKLLATDALEVSWTAKQLGTELGLITGRATLVRKMD